MTPAEKTVAQKPWKVDDAGLEIIKAHEGIRLRAYRDSVGVPTIGIGHTEGVTMGMRITEEEAMTLLRKDIEWVEACLNQHVHVDLSQSQVNALADFVFNVGCGAFAKSTLLKRINTGLTKAAGYEMSKWVHAGHKVLPGLVKRRAAERALFEEGLA